MFYRSAYNLYNTFLVPCIIHILYPFKHVVYISRTKLKIDCSSIKKLTDCIHVRPSGDWWQAAWPLRALTVSRYGQHTNRAYAACRSKAGCNCKSRGYTMQGHWRHRDGILHPTSAWSVPGIITPPPPFSLPHPTLGRHWHWTDHRDNMPIPSIELRYLNGCHFCLFPMQII